MDFTQFLQGFAQIDVCYAYPGWHAMSFPNAFPITQDKTWRLCTTAYLIQPAAAVLSHGSGGGGEVAMYISALQPTKRGKWCRTDRKKR
jgi:hypothetical protein